jgi:hypothetical protein
MGGIAGGQVVLSLLLFSFCPSHLYSSLGDESMLSCCN